MLLYTPATRRLWRRCARVGTPIRAHSTPSSRQEVQFRTATWILPKGRSRSCGRKDAAATCKPTASTPGHTKCRRGSPSFALLLRAISIACSRAGRSAAKDRGVARAITSPRRWSKAITRDAAVRLAVSARWLSTALKRRWRKRRPAVAASRRAITRRPGAHQAVYLPRKGRGVGLVSRVTSGT